MEKSDLTTRGIVALLLIVIGIAGILKQVFHIEIFSMFHLWPIFVLGPGIAFEWGYFSKRNSPGLLVPGGILITLGILFFFEANTGWIFSGYTWPVYILAPAIGLFQLYWFGGRDRALLIPVGILTAVAAVSFCTRVLGGFFTFINSSLVWPVVLIVIGLVVLFSREHKEY